MPGQDPDLESRSRYYMRPRAGPPDYERLEKLAAFLDGLKPKLFRFSDWVDVPEWDGGLHPAKALERGGGCGTTACAVGWLPLALPEDFRYDEDYTVALADPILAAAHNNPELQFAAQAAMNLSEREADYLFIPCDHDHSQPRRHGLAENSSAPRTCNYSGLGNAVRPKTVAKQIRKAIAYWRSEEPQAVVA